MSGPQTSQEVVIPVHGMTCGGCVASVQRALSRLDGVEQVEVDLEPGRARVRYMPERVVRAELVAAIEAAGFAVPA